MLCEGEEPPVFARVGRLLRPAAGPAASEPPAIAKLCKERGYLKRSADADAPREPASHNMYGNLHFMGVMHVPPGVPTRELAGAVCADFFAGRFGAMTENKPEGAWPFYIDWDLEFEGWPSETQWRVTEAIEKAAIVKFYPGAKLDDAQFTSTVTTSGVTNTTASNGRTIFKVGMHAYYPQLFVNQEQALFLSTAIIVALKQRFPDEPLGTWERRLDQAVYGDGRGLRWVYQFKHGPCACGATNKPKRAGRATAADGTDPSAAAAAMPKQHAPRCAQCAGCGYVPDVSSSMHAPLYRVTGFGNRTFFDAATRHTPTVELLLECSLRAYARAQPTPGFVRYATAAPIPLLLLKTKRGAGGSSSGAAAAGVTVACTGDTLFNRWDKATDAEALPLTSTEARVIQACLRAKDVNWTGLRVKALFKQRSARSSYFKVRVQGEGSGYCLNYRQSHRSAAVYFIVRSRGVVQKCTCRCMDVRSSGKPCGAFESTEFALTEDEAAALFGNGNLSSGAFAGSSGAAASMHGAFMVPVSGAVARAFAASSTGGGSAGIVTDEALPAALAPIARFVSNTGAGVPDADSALTAGASAGLAFGMKLTTLAPRIFGNPMARSKMVTTLKRPRP